MVTTNQAKDLIEAHIETTNIIEVPLMDALGGYLAEHVFSPINIPSFSNSAMDGYAFRYIDTLTTDTFKIVGEVAAGKNSCRSRYCGNARGSNSRRRPYSL